jgi:hypothetical protein
MGNLVGHRTPELQPLRRVALAHPEAIQDDVREAYQQARLNSIFTLRVAQPVRRAAEVLLPAAGIAYHTIAGSLPGENPPGDGIVPIASAELPGAASTLIVESDHRLYQNEEAIDEIVRILHDDRAPGPVVQ